MNWMKTIGHGLFVDRDRIFSHSEENSVRGIPIYIGGDGGDTYLRISYVEKTGEYHLLKTEGEKYPNAQSILFKSSSREEIIKYADMWVMF